MRGFGTWHAQHQKRTDSRVAEMMVHLRRAFDIFETLMLNPVLIEPLPPEPPSPSAVAAQVAKKEKAPLMVRPKQASQMMSLSVQTIYRLMNRGELESLKVGPARFILINSIEAFIARKAAEDQKERKAIQQRKDRYRELNGG